ncbi:unnamed protein product [Rotaria sp. Silwood2]|nr:unnamed protein product [Rotaria sp. Silwood2]CAF4577487.1 unnamed protein product [Rotaria sp. Silwood2]
MLHIVGKRTKCCFISCDLRQKIKQIYEFEFTVAPPFPKFTEPDTIFNIKSLSKRTNNVTTQNELDQIQNELQQLNMFGNHANGTKADRQLAIELRAELQTRLNALHSIMADIARGTLNQTAALAKMNDLRYADK